MMMTTMAMATATMTMMMTKTTMMMTIMIRTATETTMTLMATTSMTRMRMKTMTTTMPTENSTIFISLFGSQFKLLAVVLHRLLLCCPCITLPYHPSPLLSRHCLSPCAAPLLVLDGCCIASFLVVPPSLLHRLFVELPPLSPHRRLSLSPFVSLP